MEVVASTAAFHQSALNGNIPADLSLREPNDSIHEKAPGLAAWSFETVGQLKSFTSWPGLSRL
jgi:hypothetical protein